MKIVHVNNCDLVGRRFNGYDLHLSLNEMGHEANQIVVEKKSSVNTVIGLHEPDYYGGREFSRTMLRNIEKNSSLTSMIYPYGKQISEMKAFLNADIVHYHLIHNYFLSLIDFQKMVSKKKSVWTVHDPWIISGHCVYPLNCEKWLDGCEPCDRYLEEPFTLKKDTASQLWKLKKQIYRELDIDIIVSSNFMLEYIQKSPLTSHFNRIHKIPFGIECERFANRNKKSARDRFGISNTAFVVAYRTEQLEIKGTKYIEEAVNKLNMKKDVVLLTVGTGTVSKDLKNRYKVVELGWQNDEMTLMDFYSASDVFLMPSLAESFGLMAIEAMAAGCVVIAFKTTVLEEIICSPNCGIAVSYKNSEEIKNVLEFLIENRDECRVYGEKSKVFAFENYSYDSYVKRHLELYQDIMKR